MNRRLPVEKNYISKFLQVDDEDDASVSDVDTLSEDEDEGAWLEPAHGGGNLPAVVRRRLVPTVSLGAARAG